MPYKIYSYKGKYRVCKPGGKKCFSKKGLPKAKAEAQRRALYASENIEESLSRSNLKFKLVVPPAQGEKKCTVVYKVLSEAATDLFVVYEVGTTLDSTQCMYFAVVITMIHTENHILKKTFTRKVLKDFSKRIISCQMMSKLQRVKE